MFIPDSRVWKCLVHYFSLFQLKRTKVAYGKINHENAIKSCQIVLFISKSATERLSSGTVVCYEWPIFTYQAFLRKQWTKNIGFWNLMLLNYLLTWLKDPWTYLVDDEFLYPSLNSHILLQIIFHVMKYNSNAWYIFLIMIIYLFFKMMVPLMDTGVEDHW